MNARKYCCFISAILALTVATWAQPQATEQKTLTFKVAAKPLFRDPVYDGAADPVVCWNRGERKWFMFYTNRRANAPNTPGVSWVHGTRIGIAESSDGGASWKYRGTADINYGQGDYSYWAPEVIEHDGLYHMFLTFVPGMHTDWSGTRDIIHLTSKDILKWKYESTLKLSSDRVIDACVMRLPDGTWRMWYNNERDNKSIYYVDSADLLTWKDRGKAIGDRPGEGPKVFRWKGRYWMVVDVWRGLGVYVSDDCQKWTRKAKNLLEEPGKGPDDKVKGGHPDVVVSGDRAYLFYFTHPGRVNTEPADDLYEQRRSSIQVVELEYKDGEITCDRDKPTYILLQPTNDQPKPAKRYVITDYGAIGDGKTLNTKAIQSAIDKCKSDGGGVLVIPKGTFLTGSIFFKQGVDLHVAKDGVLKGTVNPDDYPQVDTRWEGEERVWTAALLNFFDITDVELTGEGLIDGSGDEWMERYPRDSGELRIGRPRLIAIQNCRDVRVCGLSFKNQACWGLFILYSENVLVENLTIRAAHNIISSDGIDVDSSRNVHIKGCDIDVNDDCIAIKSGRDEDGRRVNRPAEDILVEKCHFRYGHGGVSMGSEMSGGIRNVEIRDCIMEADNWAPIRFKSQPSRGGVVENITYRDIILKNTRKAFEFNMAWRMRPPIKPPSDPLPVVRNVRIINVSGTVDSVGDMYGLKDSPIENVTFENCKVKAQSGFVLENVKGLELSGLHIEVKQGEAIIRKNAQ